MIASLAGGETKGQMKFIERTNDEASNGFERGVILAVQTPEGVVYADTGTCTWAGDTHVTFSGLKGASTIAVLKYQYINSSRHEYDTDRPHRRTLTWATFNKEAKRATYINEKRFAERFGLTLNERVTRS
jgi:hypothetical protein